MIPQQIANNVPVVGSVYGFCRTANRIYNATTPGGAAKEAVKGILIDCSPPDSKYPVLCASLITSGACCITTGGNLIAISVFVNTGRLIVEA